MAGLVPAIHVLPYNKEVVDTWHKSGHDDQRASIGKGAERAVPTCRPAPLSSLSYGRPPAAIAVVRISDDG